MNRLNVLIMHHHLRGGGVTEVIRRTFEIFNASHIQTGLITGEPIVGQRGIPDQAHRIVDGLSYGVEGIQPTLQRVYEQCLQAAKELFGTLPDVWHIHNHSLGKNAIYTAVTLRLISEGHKVVLHTHDFSEDNRPQNYRILKKIGAVSEDLTDRMYPVTDHVHYAVLSTRDSSVLLNAGIPSASVTVVANPVTVPAMESELTTDHSSVPPNTFLYPVRAIPRKNIGEFILWAALYSKEATFALTLAPKNPRYSSHYKEWVRFANLYELPVVFEAGKAWQCSYKELITASHSFITTSIAEGFGLVYLESYLFGKPLIGRDLPSVTADFKQKEVSLDHLYHRLPIPLQWLDRHKLKVQFKEKIESIFTGYERTLTSAILDHWLGYIFREDSIDFGALDANTQQSVIKAVLDDPVKTAHLREFCVLDTEGQPVQDNNEYIRKNYSVESYAQRLEQIYRDLQIAKSDPKPAFVSSQKVLDGFLKPEFLSLLRD